MKAFPSKPCMRWFALGCILASASMALADPPSPATPPIAPTSAPAGANAGQPGAGQTGTPTTKTEPAPTPDLLALGDSTNKVLPLTRFGFMLAGAAIAFLLYSLLSGLHPFRLIVGVDNRYSNSQFQIALWFFIVIASYIATFALRWWSGIIGGIEIPAHLLLISGMSAFTYGAAKGITTGKVNDALAQGLPNPKASAAAPSLLNDLTHNDLAPAPAQLVAAAPDPAAALAAPIPAAAPAPTGLDLGDAQMVMVTLLAAVTYLINFYYFLGIKDFAAHAVITLPDADATILSIFGLGQGAYLVKKAVGNAGQA